jgi:hypothetical protein
MPSYTQKLLPCFLTVVDERDFSDKLSSAVPSIRFVDGARWSHPEPRTAPSIDACASGICFLWDSGAVPELPFKGQSDGSYRGPTSGVVIQMIRCQQKGDLLLSGDLGVGFDTAHEAMREFVASVWSVLKTLNATVLDSYDVISGIVREARIKEYVVGPDAAKAASGCLTLRHCSADVYYRPSK